MSVQPELRRRPFLNATHWPEIRPMGDPNNYKEIRLTRWELTQLACARFIANFWPDTLGYLEKHPGLKRGTTFTVAFVITIVLLFFRPKLEPRYVALIPWHVELHNAWLYDHSIRESTWILDEEAQNHTSNDPSLKGTVLLQFPQRNGGSSITLRDVGYDGNAYYGVMSMKKLEEDHVPMRLLFGIGEGARPVMGVEIIGRDIVAMTWGSKGTYIVKAWSLKKCYWSCPIDWAVRSLSWTPQEIPSATMRELVDKHRTIPAASKDESVTPWQQRAMDEELDMARKEKKRKAWWP